MDDLVQWLRAHLDEDERTARAAEQNGDVKDGRWFDDEDEEVIDDSAWRIAFTVDAGTRAHIARHDPARVLREIDAKRRIIEQHEHYVAERRRMMGGWDPQSDDSPILFALATVYADRPGYREEWRP